jgi:hypothetical protein
MADTVTLSDAPTVQILRAIGDFQHIQRTNAPTSIAWQLASEQLAKLFAEMARRPKLDDLTVEYTKWAKSQPGDVLGRGDATEALAHPDTTDAQKAYLRAFIVRWEAAADAR